MIRKAEPRQYKMETNIDNEIYRWTLNFKKQEHETEWRLWMIDSNRNYLILMVTYIAISNVRHYSFNAESKIHLLITELVYPALGILSVYQIYWSSHSKKFKEVKT